MSVRMASGGIWLRWTLKRTFAQSTRILPNKSFSLNLQTTFKKLHHQWCNQPKEAAPVVQPTEFFRRSKWLQLAVAPRADLSTRLNRLPSARSLQWAKNPLFSLFLCPEYLKDDWQCFFKEVTVVVYERYWQNFLA